MQVFVVDDQKPEVVAMLQALYSRSPQSVLKHLEQVKAKGADNFMKMYYVGYGHKSIGDCGTTSIFIENVSMLVAKAVQDTPLYNGQEASTRYLDMATQAVINPLGTSEGKAVQDAWMALYSDALAALIPVLKEQNPRKADEKESVWEKAIKAKAFDIARGLLPAGVTTFVAWHVNLRQAHDHLLEMSNHPLVEVRDAADLIQANLKERYPSSFGFKQYDAQSDYIKKSMSRFAFFYEPITQFSYFDTFNRNALSKHRDLLSTRPPKTELHQRFRQYGQITFEFPLDFGSYRDLQRQRSAVQEMPLLTTRLGFHQWYLAHLPGDVPERIEACRRLTDRLEAPDEVKQYYIPMGFNVPVVLTCSLPSAVYIAELRSGPTVHPTLRIVAQQIGDVLQARVPDLVMHHDKTGDIWSTKRGTQDIVKN